MDILKVVRHTDGGDKYLNHCTNYCFKEKTDEDEKLIETAGYGVSTTNPKDVYKQMHAVKEYFGKTGDNPLMHLIVSFDGNTSDAETAKAYTAQIADYLKDDYQMVTAVHQENQGGSKYHAHIVMNSVNYNNGRLFHSGFSEMDQLAIYIHNLTGNFCRVDIVK